MRTILYALLAIFLLPFYPFLKGIRRTMAEKMRIGEKVVVVVQNGRRKKILVT
jgi:hypothetical protein